MFPIHSYVNDNAMFPIHSYVNDNAMSIANQKELGVVHLQMNPRANIILTSL
jgi:hypothetical protein